MLLCYKPEGKIPNSQEAQSSGKIVVSPKPGDYTESQFETDAGTEQVLGNKLFRCNITFNDGVITHFMVLQESSHTQLFLFSQFTEALKEFY